MRSHGRKSETNHPDYQPHLTRPKTEMTIVTVSDLPSFYNNSSTNTRPKPYDNNNNNNKRPKPTKGRPLVLAPIIDPISGIEHSRPVLSYNELIIEAIRTAKGEMASLQEIYDYIQSTYPFFQSSTVVRRSATNLQAWQNSIRHNLSVQKKTFERTKRPASNPGKGGLWCLVAANPYDTRDTETCVNSPYSGSSELMQHTAYYVPTPSRQPNISYESNLTHQEKLRYDSTDCNVHRKYGFEHQITSPIALAPQNYNFEHQVNIATQNDQSNNINCNRYAPSTSSALNYHELPDPRHLATGKQMYGTQLMEQLAHMAVISATNEYLAPSVDNFPWPSSSSSPEYSAQSISSACPPSSSFTYRPAVHMLVPYRNDISMLNPLVGDQTLLQATYSDTYQP